MRVIAAGVQVLRNRLPVCWNHLSLYNGRIAQSAPPRPSLSRSPTLSSLCILPCLTPCTTRQSRASEPPSELDKAKDLDEANKQPEINVDELELVVTPKT
jgi:hypothetical protein